jgi:hypothetical protein
MATRITRRGMLLGAGVGLAAVGLGCGGMNPFLMVDYALSGGKATTPAEFPLTPPDKKKDARVVVLVSSKTGLPPDLTGVDKMLNAELVKVLTDLTKANEEKVQVLKMPALDKFRDDSPNWRSANPYDIGKKFDADYMIDVEIQEMDLFKPGSRGQWLQGRATVSVHAYDLNKPLKEAAQKWEFPISYPQHGYEREVESRAQVSTFRMEFVQRIASNIAVKFSATDNARRKQID